jgi:hypothetical protein
VKVIYLAGATRSGSTLLHNLLAQIEGFEGVGELRDIWHYGLLENRRCGCGVPLRSCPYWVEVLERAFGSMGAVEAAVLHDRTERFRTRDLLLSSPARRRRLVSEAAPLVDALTAVYLAIRDHAGCQVILDSSKNPAYGYLLRGIPDLDVSFVHLVRDAQAVAHSLGRRKESEPGRDLPRKSAWRASADWCSRNLACEVFLGRPTERFVRVRYEDLVRHPAAVIQSIVTFAGEPAGDLGFVDEQEVQLSVRPHTVFGNPVRFREGAVRLHLDDEWHHRMRRSDATLVRSLTAPLRLRYGYLGRR